MVAQLPASFLSAFHYSLFLQSSFSNALFEAIFMKVLQPLLDVLLQNSELTFSGTNSMVSSIQKNVLILFRSVLALNGLGTCKWAPRYQQVQLPRGRPLC